MPFEQIQWLICVARMQGGVLIVACDKWRTDGKEGRDVSLSAPGTGLW